MDKSMTELNEAFENRKREKGEIKFSATKLDDAHIKKIIAEISKSSEVPENVILEKIHKRLAEFNDIADKAPLLYSTIQQNAIENEVFKLVEEASKKGYGLTGTDKFNVTTFYKLFRAIKVEHEQFFPLRNFIDHKTLHNPVIIITPSPQKEYKQYNKIATAAATPKGQFIFNSVFMQNLIDFAHYKGIKPKGKKYVGHGGDIPDSYAYIEFLIIHELMHYTYADFHYHKILKTSNKIINWIGDFRSNYLLVKSGYEQLPLGLFNDDINYDRQKTYKEMHDVVKAEFDKLSALQQKKVNKAIGDIEGGTHQADKKKDKPKLQEGQIVRTPDGKIRAVSKVNADGTADTRELNAEEKKKLEEKAKKDGILGTPKDVKDALK
jgi:uncharacterized protein YdbL (DUF1318 family)